MRIYFGDGDAAIKGVFPRVARAAARTLRLPKRVCVELDFSEPEDMRALNLRTRGVDAVTDVLSFPNLTVIPGQPLVGRDSDYTGERGELHLGSIILCPARAAAQAEEYGHGIDREAAFLFCHGILHLLGYDHETQEGEQAMCALQEAILKKAGFTR
jgi:probable rRNA maturation factor